MTRVHNIRSVGLEHSHHCEAREIAYEKGIQKESRKEKRISICKSFLNELQRISQKDNMERIQVVIKQIEREIVESTTGRNFSLLYNKFEILMAEYGCEDILIALKADKVFGNKINYLKALSKTLMQY